MVSTYTANKRIEQPSFNSYVDTWDVPVNNDWAIIDLALGGSVSINTTGLSGNVTLSTAQYQPLKIVLTGTPTAAINYRVPSGVGGLWVVRNNTSGGFAVTVDSLAGGSAVTIPAAQNTLVTCDGTASGMFLAINTSPAAAGSTTQLQYNSAGVLAGSSNFTFDGTTATIAGLSVTGSTVLGDAAGDTLALNGTAIAIPNTTNFGTNTLFLQPTGTKVGIGTATLGAEMLTVAGVIYATAGGVKFPDGTTQTSASAAVAGSDTQVQYNDAGSFGAEAAFTYNKTTDLLTVPNLTVGTAATIASATITTAAISGGTIAGAAISGGTVATTTTISALTACMFFFPGAAANIPANSLLCYGQAVSRTTYAGIFAKISTAWGAGDGSTTFNLPDMRGRVPGGIDNMGGSAASRLTATTMTPDGNSVGATGGTQTHTLTEAEMPSHSHLAYYYNIGLGGSGGGASAWVGGGGTATSAAGSSAAHLNVQPTALGCWIIFI